MRTHPVIETYNTSSVVSDDDVAAICKAVATQAKYHLQPHWGSSASIAFHPGERKANPAAGSWVAIFQDDLDVDGALGYHDLTQHGQPVLFVGAKIDVDNGYLPSVTFSHEVLEMLCDPYVADGIQVGDRWYAREVCDAVEADADGYQIHAIRVSNFVLPFYFHPDLAGDYDYLGQIQQPLEIRPGGYLSWWDARHGWQQDSNFQGQPGREAGRTYAVHVPKAHATLGERGNRGRAA